MRDWCTKDEGHSDRVARCVAFNTGNALAATGDKIIPNILYQITPATTTGRPEARKYVSAYMSLPLRKAYSGFVTALDPAEQDLERPQAVGCPQTRYRKAILVSRLLDIGAVEPLSK